MLVKVSFVAVASVAAFAVSRVNFKSSRKRNPPVKPADKDGSRSSPEEEIEEDDKEKSADSEFTDEEEHGQVERRKRRTMERRRKTHEGKLLENYGFKEQRSCIAHLQKLLKLKKEEVELLSITMNSLRAERKKLLEKVKEVVLVKKQLEIAKKVKDLHEKISKDRNNWVRKKLLTLAQDVSDFERAVRSNRDHENIEKKIINVELEAMEIKRRNKELEMERRGLRIMLAAAEENFTSLSNMMKTEALQKELRYQRSLNTCLRFETQKFLAPSTLSKNPSQESRGSEKVAPAPIPHQNPYNKSTSTTSTIDSSTVYSSSSSQKSSMRKKHGFIHNIGRWGRPKGSSRFSFSSSSESFSREKFPLEAGGLTRRLYM